MVVTKTGDVVDADAEFDEFAGAVWRRLRWTGYLLTGDEQLAEDLAQTALVKTYAAWSRVRRRDAAAYARKVLVNANIDRLRRRRFHEVAEQPEVAVEQRHDVEDRELLVSALATVSEQERKVLVLRFYCDLSEAMVAAELGIGIGTVKSTTSRALAKLRTRNPALLESEGVS